MTTPSHTSGFFEKIVASSITPTYTEENSPFALDCKCGRVAIYSARQGIMVPPLPKFKRRTDVKQNAINYVLQILQSGGIQITMANIPERIIHNHIYVGKYWQLQGLPDNPHLPYLFMMVLCDDSEIDEYKQGVCGYFDENNMQVLMRHARLSKGLICYFSPRSGDLTFNAVEINHQFADSVIETSTRAIESGNLPPQINCPEQCEECPFKHLCMEPNTAYPTCRNCAYYVMNQGGVIGCGKYQMQLISHETYKGCDTHLYRPDFLGSFTDFKSADVIANNASYDNMLNGQAFTNGQGSQEFTSMEIHLAPNKDMLGDSNVQKIKNMFDARIIK